MSPSTSAGQIFCVFFALFGIPLNMMVLNRVGKYMLVIERNISNFIENKTERKVRPPIPNSVNPSFHCSIEAICVTCRVLLGAEVYPLLCPPGVLPVRSSSLLRHAHDGFPAAGGLDSCSGHLLLLHHPEHHWLWRLCGRHGSLITFIINQQHATGR